MPRNWCWATIGDLFQLQAGKFIEAPQISTCKDATHIYPCYGGNGLRGYVESYNRDGLFPIIGRQGALCGNINIAEGKFYATEHAVVVETFANIDIQLFVYFLIQLNLNQYATATAQPGLAVKTINEVPIPLPPINEQHRISMAIEKSLDTLSEIDQSKHAIRKSILQLKSRILDLAISGKLAAQDCSDEPALELLRRINPSYAPCDNRHYENLPQNWEECALKDIVEIQNGYAFKSSLYSNDGVRVIRITNVQDGYIMDDSPKYYPLSHMDGLEDYMLKGNDILMSLTGNVGRVAMMPAGLLPAALNQRVCCITPKSSEVCKEFLFYLLRTDSFITSCIESGKGVAQLNVSTEWLKSYRIALPPKDEQRRIVKAIQNIMTKIDKILADL